MLCATEFDETDQKPLFKPLGEAVSIFTKIKDLLTALITLSGEAKVNSVTCSSRAIDGTDYGSGAVWHASMAQLVQNKNGQRWVQGEFTYTVVENLGTQIEILQEIINKECCPQKTYPTTLVITLQENGSDSLVSTQMLTTAPSLHESIPMECCQLPCLWPLVIVNCVVGVICQPCIYLCGMPQLKQKVNKQCSQINNKMKSLAENGPSAEEMVDPAPLLMQMQQQQIQMQQMQTQMQMQQQQPPVYSDGGGSAPGMVVSSGGGHGFCDKCGTPREAADSKFCGKCGDPFS